MKVIVSNAGVVFILMACLVMPGYGQPEINMNNRFQNNKDGSYVTFGTTMANFPVIKGAL